MVLSRNDDVSIFALRVVYAIQRKWCVGIPNSLPSQGANQSAKDHRAAKVLPRTVE
jgi:hypothetical protein